MNDILFSPIRLSDLEILIEKSVQRVISNFSTEVLTPHENSEPFGDFNWLKATCTSIPASTLRIKSAAGEIPGVKKFGKRVLYDKVVVLSWLRNQDQHCRTGLSIIEQNAQSQVENSFGLRKRRRKQDATSTRKAA